MLHVKWRCLANSDDTSDTRPNDFQEAEQNGNVKTKTEMFTLLRPEPLHCDKLSSPQDGSVWREILLHVSGIRFLLTGSFILSIVRASGWRPVSEPFSGISYFFPPWLTPPVTRCRNVTNLPIWPTIGLNLIQRTSCVPAQPLRNISISRNIW